MLHKHIYIILYFRNIEVNLTILSTACIIWVFDSPPFAKIKVL